MRTIFSKRKCFLVAILVLFSSPIALLFVTRPGAQVTVLDPGFHVLTAKLSHGTTHKVFFGKFPEGDVRQQLYRWGLKVQRLGGIECNMGKDSYAFVLRYSGKFARNQLDGVEAEILDEEGTATPLRWAAEGYSATQNEYARIWALDPPPTSPVTIRLTFSNKVRLAEVRIGGRDVR